jgi:hypothetical protein
MHSVITEQEELNPSWFYAKCGKEQASLILGKDKKMVIFWHRWDAKKDEWIYELDKWLPERISINEALRIFMSRIEELGI